MSKEEIREHEYKFMSYGKNEKSLGNVWWNGKKVEAEESSLLSLLKQTKIRGDGEVLTIEDGIEFLKALPDYFRSYISAMKV